MIVSQVKFLSTLSLRRATCGRRVGLPVAGHFYPRSPCGERPCGRRVGLPVAGHFYPRSPCGERQFDKQKFNIGSPFLSTLSLRRATRQSTQKAMNMPNFYPRSPCGERLFYLLCSLLFFILFLSTLSLRRATAPNRRSYHCNRNFYPRSPCGERHGT